MRRPIMRPRSWTELFFLDEATALSAAHRPCAFCRNADYKHFRSLWQRCYGDPVSADIIDIRLHRDRLMGRNKRTYRNELALLPDGTYVALDGTAWLVWGCELLEWSAKEYTTRRPRATKMEVDVLTPRSLVDILGAGYRPGIHPSAG